MILNIYKEKDWTSFDVVAKVRGILNARLNPNVPNKLKRKRKVGHAGTLDPLAEGVLIILTDADTRRQDELMKTDKEYECEISFGATSETYDLEGDLTDHTIPADFDLQTSLEQAIPKYVGEIEQTVPYYSAAKVDGKALYKSARSGKKADLESLPTKKVTIYDIKTLETFEKDGRPTVRLLVVCSKGTYIRSLANDLGKDLGVGAVLVGLVRTRVGDFSVQDSVKIADLKI